jgi:hypothetical protein
MAFMQQTQNLHLGLHYCKWLGERTSISLSGESIDHNMTKNPIRLPTAAQKIAACVKQFSNFEKKYNITLERLECDGNNH